MGKVSAAARALSFCRWKSGKPYGPPVWPATCGWDGKATSGMACPSQIDRPVPSIGTDNKIQIGRPYCYSCIDLGI